MKKMKKKGSDTSSQVRNSLGNDNLLILRNLHGLAFISLSSLKHFERRKYGKG